MKKCGLLEAVKSISSRNSMAEKINFNLKENNWSRS
jgi:hypothetical protein